MNLRNLIEQADKGAVDVFNKTGKLLPMYHMIRRDGIHAVVPMPPLPNDDCMSLMRIVMQGLDIVAYVFIDEAWAIHRDKDWRPANLRKQVKDEPDRDEIIMYLAESETEPSLHGTRLIDPVSRELGPLQIDQPSLVDGRMTNLLPTKGQAS